jgi:Na+-translocating ferredoxin:NAD+ oxidoreductase RnfG subunit
MNKYLKVSLTLATIASGSALLIGLVNLGTYGFIAQNRTNKVNSGIKKLYPQAEGWGIHEFVAPGEHLYEPEFDATRFPHIKSVNHVEWEEGEEKVRRYVYNTTGKNAYGQVDLLLSVEDGKVAKMYVVTNTESYGPTLEDNYINKYNNGYLTDLADVKCGATYGAKTVKEQCDEAVAHWTEFYKEAK